MCVSANHLYSNLLIDSNNSYYSMNLEISVNVFQSILDSNDATVLSPEGDNFQLELVDYLYSHGTVRVSSKAVISSQMTLILLNDNYSYLTSPTAKNFWNPHYYYIVFSRIMSSNLTNLLIYLWDNYSACNVFVISANNSRHVVTLNILYKRVDEVPLLENELWDYLTHRYTDWKGSNFYMIFSGIFNKFKTILPIYEEQFINVIAQKFNFTPVILNTSDENKFGQRFDNGTYIGTFKDLIERKANMTTLPHFILNHEVELPFSHYLTSQKLCFAVPKAGRMPHFLAIFKSLDIIVWVVLFSIYFLVGCTYSILRRVSHKIKLEPKFRNVDTTLVMLCLFLGLSIPVKPEMTYERLILSPMLLISFFTVNFFQSILITILSAPSFYKNMETREEIARSKLEIWTTSQDIFTRMKSLPDVNFKLKAMGTDSNGFKVGWLEKISSLVDPNNLRYKNVESHITRDCPVTYFSSHYFQRGFILAKMINTVIDHLLQSGIVSKWVKDSYGELVSPITYDDKSAEPVTSTEALQIKDLISIFNFLCFSLSICFLVFVCELIKGYKNKFRY